MSNAWGWVALAAVGGVGLAVLLAAPGTAQASEGERMSDLERRVVRHVLAAESGGKYTAINANLDGAGVSVGLLQWSQLGGGLAELVDAWLAEAPALARQHLGPHVGQVLEVARAKSLAPVDGEVLWSPRWLQRWRAALGDPTLQRIQDQVVVRGVHMQGALAAAKILGLRSVRSLALLFDRSVQQGPGRVRRVAEAVKARQGEGAPEAQVLVAVANGLVEPFRRRSPPTEAQDPAARLQWKPVGGEWHLFSGAFDLYASSRRRVDAILSDPSLAPAVA